MKKIAVVVVSMLLVWGSIMEAATYRTFTPGDLSVNKAVVKKVIGVDAQFVFTNTNTTTVNALYVVFSAPVTIVKLSGPFSGLIPQDQSSKSWMFYGTTLNTGDQITIQVTTSSKSIQAKTSFWANDVKIVGAPKSNVSPANSQIKIPMPNTANVRDNVFSTKTITVTVGIPQPMNKKNYGWVTIKTSGDMLASLFTRGDVHFGQPRGFAMLSNGAPFHGQLKSLPPSVENDKLFADLLALKFNILASDKGITPPGFGDLYFNDPSSQFLGKTLRQIAAHADSMMTFWHGVYKVDYVYIDSLISKVNGSFCGPIDTISFCSKLMLTGVQSAYENIFTSSNPVIKPIAEDNSVGNLPLTSELKQNYPNPFNPTTRISFTLLTSSIVTLKVYNMLGQEVATLFNQQQVDKGNQEIAFNGGNLSSGTYIYRLDAKGTDDNSTFEKTMKMVLVK